VHIDGVVFVQAYALSSECRGVACIINVQRDRRGTDVDRDRLQLLFQQLHFDVKTYNDADGLSANVSLFASLPCCLGIPVYSDHVIAAYFA